MQDGTEVDSHDEADATPTHGDPLAIFQEWFAEARAKEKTLADAMSLATVDALGAPDCRMVLLKAVDRRGFTFYTNAESAKGDEFAANPRAALCFHWKTLRRQVRVRGEVEAVSDEEADAYFATRDRSAQIGAWASDQSRPMPERRTLARRVVEAGLQFGLGRVPRPPHWRGYRVKLETIEFWRERPFRLHERVVFQREAGAWRAHRLFP